MLLSWLGYESEGSAQLAGMNRLAPSNDEVTPHVMLSPKVRNRVAPRALGPGSGTAGGGVPDWGTGPSDNTALGAVGDDGDWEHAPVTRVSMATTTAAGRRRLEGCIMGVPGRQLRADW